MHSATVIIAYACADAFTRPALLWLHANGRHIVALRFAGHRTTKMLGPCCAKSLTGFKENATSDNIVVVPCKWTQPVGPNNVACWWEFEITLIKLLINSGKRNEIRFMTKTKITGDHYIHVGLTSCERNEENTFFYVA